GHRQYRPDGQPDRRDHFTTERSRQRNPQPQRAHSPAGRHQPGVYQPQSGTEQPDAAAGRRADSGDTGVSALGWRLEAGGWRLEAGGWRLEAGGWTVSDLTRPPPSSFFVQP